MHNLKIFGNTFKEIKKDKIKNVHRFLIKYTEMICQQLWQKLLLDLIN